MVTKTSKTKLRQSNVGAKRSALNKATAKSEALRKNWLDIADKAGTIDNHVKNQAYAWAYDTARKAYNRSLVEKWNANAAYKNAVKSQKATTKAYNDKQRAKANGQKLLKKTRA